MSLKIALIFARAELRRGTRIKHFMVPPYSLQILSALTPPGHTLQLIDEYHRPAAPELSADLIGISVWTAAANRAYALADHYRSCGIPVVLGGPHISVCPDEAQSHADAIVVGEAEAVWPQVVRDAECGELQPRYTGSPLSLEHSPQPDWAIVPSEDYAVRLSLMTTRGCARSCDFCFESGRPKPNFRRRPLEQILQELDARPAPVVAFLDNDIAVDRPHARDLFTELIPRRRHWLGMTSIEIADDEALLDLMARSGCRTLFIGFESIIPESLGEVHKRCNRVENYRRNVQRIHDRGIMVNGSFVFGFDHDGPDVFQRTVDFGIAARLETATFTVLTPYPGTALYQRLQHEGRITDRDWSHYDTTHAVFHPERMTPAQLEAGYYEAYQRFYTWKSIFERCRKDAPGFTQRLFLNLAYKRIEPLYRFLGHPVPIGRLRFLFDWYAHPFAPAGAAACRSVDRKRKLTTE